MEEVKHEIERKIKLHLGGILSEYEDLYGVELELPMPQEFLWDFDSNFTIINKYPACMILGVSEKLNDLMSLGCRVVSENSIAVVMIIKDQDPTLLDRKKSRYGEAIIEFMKEFNSSSYGREYITMFGPAMRVDYSRAVRDEAIASYVGSVWVFTEARVDKTL